MVKKVSHKIISISMTFVVLLSTMSFTIDMHYCGKTLVDIAIFQKVKTCGMEMQDSQTKDCSITKEDCCSDEQTVIQGQNELELSFETLSFKQQQFVASFIYYTHMNLFQGVDKDVNSYREYSPPLVVREIYKLDQMYLI